jgi:hemerythrin-like domain-containing protein
MPIQLGAPPENGFDNPLGLLSDCHRRIERFLEQLIRVAEARTEQPDAPLNVEHRSALDTALRYFREAAPLHTRDEEESLFPRLRQSDSPAAREALAALDALEADHDTADALHVEVERLGRRWLESGALSATELVSLRDMLIHLRTLYQRHIAVEDTQLFPLAGQALSAEEQTEIGREMAKRRGLRLPSVAFRAPIR